MTKSARETVEQFTADVEAYAAALSPIEAVWIAGSIAHSVLHLTSSPLPDAQVRFTAGMYCEVARLMLARVARDQPRPPASLIDGFNELMERLVGDVNKTIIARGGAR